MTQGEFLTAHASYAQLPALARSDPRAVPPSRLRPGARSGGARRVATITGRDQRAAGSSFRAHDGRRPASRWTGVSWRIITGYGHAPEHAALYCEELGRAHLRRHGAAEDQHQRERVGLQPDEDPLRLFLARLSRYAQLPARHAGAAFARPAVPGPAQAYCGTPHGTTRSASPKCCSACAQPASAAQIVPILFRRAAGRSPDGFAMGEAVAHLNHLWQQGRLAAPRGQTTACLRSA